MYIPPKPPLNVVVKIAAGGKGRREIEDNIRGYTAIREDGIGYVLPLIIEECNKGEFAAVVMEDLGDSFYDTALKHETPVELYKDLILAFRDLCIVTLKLDDESRRMLNEVKSNIKSKYEGVLKRRGFVDDRDVKLVDGLDTNALSPHYSAFGCYDFTPEDVFLRERNIKYPDPKSRVRGCPIISLAAFAGVSRDSYNLPGAREGYATMESFAVNEVGPIIGITEDHASALFNLGRAMQLSISSVYRVDKDMERAKEFGRMSIEHLEKASKFEAIERMRKEVRRS
ncbi:MAG: hypothetical protein HY362_02040 [Candidatus Aenigmarchaeota archaeon]|nr:hypothetical protein [Candidatus Aenigmarchaeota archaeon]